jgi:hypothetical protein
VQHLREDERRVVERTVDAPGQPIALNDFIIGISRC